MDVTEFSLDIDYGFGVVLFIIGGIFVLLWGLAGKRYPRIDCLAVPMLLPFLIVMYLIGLEPGSIVHVGW